MALVTRCPACATAFRVEEEQLRLRQGWVRCGVCNEVFDARTALTDIPLTAASPTASSPPPAAPPAPPAVDTSSSAPLAVPLLYDDEPGLLPTRPVNVERLDAGPQVSPRGRAEPSFDASRFAPPSPPVRLDPEPRQTPSPALPPTFSEGRVERQEPQLAETAFRRPPMRLAEPMPARSSFFNESGHDEPGLATEPVLSPSARSPHPTDPLLGTPVASDGDGIGRPFSPPEPVRWPWTLGVVLAVCLLVLQFAYVFRAHIATHIPETRPYLQQLCTVLKCEVGNLTDAALLAIESSSIEPWKAGAVQTSSRSLLLAGGESPAEVEFDVNRRLALRVALRNRAPFAQPWPAMELSLTDSAENVVARRILPPELYLPDDAAPMPSMMDAGTLHMLRVPIETSAPQASGYRVLFFYP